MGWALNLLLRVCRAQQERGDPDIPWTQLLLPTHTWDAWRRQESRWWAGSMALGHWSGKVPVFKWPWACPLLFLSLGFLMYKMGTIEVFTSQHCCGLIRYHPPIALWRINWYFFPTVFPPFPTLLPFLQSFCAHCLRERMWQKEAKENRKSLFQTFVCKALAGGKTEKI